MKGGGRVEVHVCDPRAHVLWMVTQLFTECLLPGGARDTAGSSALCTAHACAVGGGVAASGGAGLWAQAGQGGFPEAHCLCRALKEGGGKRSPTEGQWEQWEGAVIWEGFTEEVTPGRASWAQSSPHRARQVIQGLRDEARESTACTRL